MLTRSLWLMPVLALLPACTHISGVVEQAPGRPLTTAVFSVGRPDGIAMYEQHHVDSRGHFDFYVIPTDEQHLYLYDSAGDPRATLRRIDPMEMRKGMHIMMRPFAPSDDLTPLR
jgi:hypothetical protein